MVEENRNTEGEVDNAKSEVEHQKGMCHQMPLVQMRLKRARGALKRL